MMLVHGKDGCARARHDSSNGTSHASRPASPVRWIRDQFNYLYSGYCTRLTTKAQVYVENSIIANQSVLSYHRSPLVPPRCQIV